MLPLGDNEVCLGEVEFSERKESDVERGSGVGWWEALLKGERQSENSSAHSACGLEVVLSPLWASVSLCR